MSNSKIAFIGGGNMARSLIGGMIATGISNQNISVSEPKADLREKLTKDFGVNALEENASAVMGVKSLCLRLSRRFCKKLSYR